MSRPIASLLAELPELAALLPLAATGSTNGDDIRTRKPVPDSRPPTRLDVVQALDTRTRATGDDAVRRYRDDLYAAWREPRRTSDGDLEPTWEPTQGVLPDLWLWARMVESEMLESSPTRPDDLPETPTMASVCDWLARHTEWAETQQWVAEYTDDVRRWHRRLRGLVGAREPRRMRHDCTSCGNRAELFNGGDVWACTECGHEDPGPRAQIRDYRYQDSRPTSTICAVFGVTEAWLWQARARRRLHPDTSKGRHPLHWWPWDVFRLRHPGVVEAYERHVGGGA